jgi:type IV fimbrial biogenesis protein FimT
LSRLRDWKDERGFTLVEMLLVIILMGILLAIASSTWFGAVESRRVDSATNQLTADLRQAHSRAINRLQPQTVTLTTGSSLYTMTGVANPVDLDEDSAANVVLVNTSAAIIFNSDGSATLPGGAATLTRTVSSADGDPAHDITINAATSRVQVVP